MSKRKKRHYAPQKREARSETSPVRAKKRLGQHFLKDEAIARSIVETLTLQGYGNVLEIGPGTGILTKYLALRKVRLVAMELDPESVAYLDRYFRPQRPNEPSGKDAPEVIGADFLEYDLSSLFEGAPFAIIGNFPYNISTQIVFRLLTIRERVPEFSGMFQKEVAKRICERPGSKTYGILSVLVQAFYRAEYLFTVHPQVFDPPPKVQSGVIRLTRKDGPGIDCDERLFFRIVKTAFNQRRKTLRNSLKALALPETLREDPILGERPEQLGVPEFLALTKKIAAHT